ncbi:MAG: TerC family protein [Hyphomicrobium sp.]
MEWLLNDISALFQALLLELEHAVSPAWWQANWVALVNILMIDLVLAGDNAIVVGMAASRVEKSIRSKVIFWGIAAAVALRVVFASVTTQLLAVIGLKLAGGILLMWVCWRMYRQLVDDEHEQISAEGDVVSSAATATATLGFGAAVWQITLADVSMSLDNVLAVAGAAKGSTLVLVIGLAVSIILMAVAANLIARLLVRYPWISWLGLLMIVWVALDMIYTGSHEVTCQTYDLGCSDTLFQGIKHRLGFGGL